METIYSKIVGTYFLGKPTQTLLNSLPVGTELYLEVDPENEHDPNAVKVLYIDEAHDYDEIMVGYIPKEKDGNLLSSAEISKLCGMDADFTVKLQESKKIEITYSLNNMDNAEPVTVKPEHKKVKQDVKRSIYNPVENSTEGYAVLDNLF